MIEFGFVAGSFFFLEYVLPMASGNSTYPVDANVHRGSDHEVEVNLSDSLSANSSDEEDNMILALQY